MHASDRIAMTGNATYPWPRGPREGQARGGLNGGRPASAAGDCSWPNDGAQRKRSTGVATASRCWAVTCDRQWPLWHGDCCSGWSRLPPWSWLADHAASPACAIAAPHPAQWIKEISSPIIISSTNGKRPSRFPLPAQTMVSRFRANRPFSRGCYRGCPYQTTRSGARSITWYGDATAHL